MKPRSPRDRQQNLVYNQYSSESQIAKSKKAPLQGAKGVEASPLSQITQKFAQIWSF